MKERELENLLKALANVRRIRLMKFINKQGEAKVGDIADHLKLSFRSTSKHLKILYLAGILDKRQEGLIVYYKLFKPLNYIVKTIL